MNKIYYAVIRNLTNSGDLSKQYVSLVFHDKYEPTIVIRQIYLSKEFSPDIKIIKTFKDLYLYERIFSIKYNFYRRSFTRISGIQDWNYGRF